jgi:hypothetical protein
MYIGPSHSVVACSSSLTTDLLRTSPNLNQITVIILAGIPARNVNKNTWVYT